MSEKLGEYLEKKKLTEEKEQFFLEQMEKASKLVKEANFEEGIQLYTSLIPVAEEMKWADKVTTIKDLIYQAREKEKKVAAESQLKLTLQEKKAREKLIYNEALDLMGRASEYFNKKYYEDALAAYKECLPKLKEIDATREIGIVEESINQCEAKIKALKMKEELKQKTKEEEEKYLAQREKELQGTSSGPGLGDYFVKKKVAEEKEQFFLEEMEKASRFITDARFNEGIQIYNSLIPVAEELKWADKVVILKDLINDAREKEKKHAVISQQQLTIQEKKAREKQVYNEALDLMERASDLFKKKNYDDALKIYRESLQKLKGIGATREIGVVEDSINQCEARIKELKKREELKQQAKEETERTISQRQQEIEPAKAKEAERIKALQEKKARETAIIDEAMALLDKANLALKEAGSPNFVSVDAKRARYNESIQLYQDARDKFLEAGWTAEAEKVNATAEGIKKERDAGVEALAKKLAASKDKYAAAKEPIITPPSQVKADAMSTEIMQKKLEQKQKRDAAFSALEDAGKALDDFEKKPKILGGQLFKENEYPEIIRLYRKALGLFKEAGWISEAVKIEESIEILRKKERDFLIEKEAFEQSQVEKAKAEGKTTTELDGRQAAALKRLQRENVIATKLEEKKKAEKAARDEIDRTLDEALKFFKKEELTLAEQAYEKAHALMVAHGWANEAASVLDTIKMIREKRAQREKMLMKIERAVDETGSYTRGVEQLSETMGLVQEQERQQSEAEKQAAIEQKRHIKALEAKYLDVLAKSQELMKNRDYDGAVGVYKEALAIAEELNWISQIQDVKDLIVAAQEKRDQERARAAKIEATKREQEIMSIIARTSAPDVVKDKKTEAAETPLSPRQREKLIGDEAYEIIDEGNRLHKAGKRVEAIEAYQKAIEKFKSIGWNREQEAVVSQIKKVQKEIDDEQQNVSKQQEAAKTKLAYDAINEAEKCLRERQIEDALACYEKAIGIFESVGWAKEAAMIRQQVETVKAEQARKLVADTASTEQARIDKAFALIDEAKKYQRDKKIFKAVEFANQALDIFKGLGDKWAREITQVQKFAAELEQEKQRKEELIKKLKTGEL
ncbi:MAG: hypothetical protein Q6370_011150 [Candidatus Sigynarchaeota archaeon]